jgi:hypothetical protein
MSYLPFYDKYLKTTQFFECKLYMVNLSTRQDNPSHLLFKNTNPMDGPNLPDFLMETIFIILTNLHPKLLELISGKIQ